jgi:high-affinity iron transporter
MSRFRPRHVGARYFLLTFLMFAGYVHAAVADDVRVPGILHMLGYIAVDYPATVSQGKVIMAAEYAEQREVASRVQAQLNTPPNVAQYTGLHQQAAELGRLIDHKAEGEQVAALSEQLRDQLLRSQTQLLVSQESPLAYCKRLLEESLAQFREGKFELANELAATAHFEGFEMAELGLSAVDPVLKQDLERELLGYRSLIKARAPEGKLVLALAHIEAQLLAAQSQFGDASLAPVIAYGSSLVILLREGLEVIVLLAIIVGLLIKTGRRDGWKYFHAGWLTALLLGFATWAAAVYAVDMRGVSRELAEGVSALLAAAILLFVGFGLHHQRPTERWQIFVETRLQGRLTHGALWSVAFVTFIVVYRELVETVLLYRSLWWQAGGAGQYMVHAGLLSAGALLVVLAGLIFKFSERLPLRWFFAVNSVLLYALAVVFAGKGVVALQEAGVVPVSSVNFPVIHVLGMYPSLQVLGLQAVLVLAALVFLSLNRREEVVTEDS